MTRSMNRTVTIPIVVNTAGTLAYIANGNSSYGRVSVISASTGGALGSAVTVGFNPMGLAINSAGTRLYVTSSVAGGFGRVSVIDTGSRTVIATINVGSQPRGIAIV